MSWKQLERNEKRIRYSKNSFWDARPFDTFLLFYLPCNLSYMPGGYFIHCESSEKRAKLRPGVFIKSYGVWNLVMRVTPRDVNQTDSAKIVGHLTDRWLCAFVQKIAPVLCGAVTFQVCVSTSKNFFSDSGESFANRHKINLWLQQFLAAPIFWQNELSTQSFPCSSFTRRPQHQSSLWTVDCKMVVAQVRGGGQLFLTAKCKILTIFDNRTVETAKIQCAESGKRAVPIKLGLTGKYYESFWSSNLHHTVFSRGVTARGFCL